MPNEKTLQSKKLIVNEIAEDLKSSCVGLVVAYKGITVDADTKLRKELREAGVKYAVVKNTMLSRAAELAGIDIPKEVLEGSTALAVCKDDYIAPAKILYNFAKENDFYNIKSGFIDGKVVSVEEIKRLAKLPSKEVLVAQTIRGLQSPIAGLANVLNGTIRGLVIALNEIAKKKSA